MDLQIRAVMPNENSTRKVNMKKIVQVKRIKTSTVVEREFKVYNVANELIGTFEDVHGLMKKFNMSVSTYVYMNKNTGLFFKPNYKSTPEELIKVYYKKTKFNETQEWYEDKEIIDKIHFNTWSGMKFRCYNPNHSAYKWYGAKGVTICNEWLDDYEAFSDWCFANGWYKGCNISRKNDEGNYEPSNCVIKTKSENLAERDMGLQTAKPVRISKDDKSFDFRTMNEAAEYLGCNIGTISNAVNPKQVNNHTAYGWDVELIESEGN